MLCGGSAWRKRVRDSTVRNANFTSTTNSVTQPEGVARRIIGFHLDAEGEWVANLECGHTQHVRHRPPWQNRPWTQTEEGRTSFLGKELICVKCKEAELR
jgi:hypothetical protein